LGQRKFPLHHARGRQGQLRPLRCLFLRLGGGCCYRRLLLLLLPLLLLLLLLPLLRPALGRLRRLLLTQQLLQTLSLGLGLLAAPTTAAATAALCACPRSMCFDRFRDARSVSTWIDRSVE
jgi:hypothetical protein